MATYRVTSPDGQKFDVTAPDTATEADVLFYAQKQFAAMKPQPAKPSQPVDKAQAAQMALEGMGPGERLLASIGSGMADLNPFQSREEVDEKRIRDAELNDTTGAKALNIAGQVLPTLAIPFGTAARAAGAGLKAAGAANLGARIGQSAAADMILTGGALGAAAPVGTEDSRAGNTVMGVAGGAVIPAVGAAWQGAKKVVAPFTKAGAQGIAGKALLDAGVPTNLSASEIVLGSSPTLVEASQSPVAAQLQKALANKNPNFRADLSTRAAEQNIARWDELRRVTGTTDDLARAIQARDDKALPVLESALRGSKKPNTQALLDVTDMIAGGPTRLRSNASSALADVRGKIAESRTAADLYAVRKEIDDMLAGRVNSDKKGAQFAASELMQLKGSLDEALNQATGGKFGKYIEKYTEFSRPIDRLEASQAFAERFRTAAPDQFGLPMLNRQHWTSAIEAPAKRFDGSKVSTRTQLSDTLNVGDMGLLDDIERDLMRSYQAQRLTSAPGSDTLQNLEGNNLLMGLLSSAPKPAGTGGLINGLLDLAANASTRRPMAELEAGLLSPSYAQGLLARAQPKQAKQIELLSMELGVSPQDLVTNLLRTGTTRALPSNAGQ